MASKETSNPVENVPVPVIVVTEATPLRGNSPSGECVPSGEEETKPEAGEQIEKSHEVEPIVPVNVEPEVENQDIAPAGGQCETDETLRNPAEALSIEENSRETSRFSYAKLCDYYIRLAEKSNTKKSLPIWLLLLLLPLTVMCMGAMHLNSCPYFPYIPGLFLALGIVGVLMLIARIILLFHTDAWEQQIKRKTIRVLVLVGCVITFSLYMCEFVIMSELPPSDDPASWDYCNPQFSRYVLTTNWLICIFVLVFLVLTFPTCLINYSEMRNLRAS